jgi:hypothetical protein
MLLITEDNPPANGNAAPRHDILLLQRIITSTQVTALFRNNIIHGHGVSILSKLLHQSWDS